MPEFDFDCREAGAVTIFQGSRRTPFHENTTLVNGKDLYLRPFNKETVPRELGPVLQTQPTDMGR